MQDSHGWNAFSNRFVQSMSILRFPKLKQHCCSFSPFYVALFLFIFPLNLTSLYLFITYPMFLAITVSRSCFDFITFSSLKKNHIRILMYLCISDCQSVSLTHCLYTCCPYTFPFLIILISLALTLSTLVLK